MLCGESSQFISLCSGSRYTPNSADFESNVSFARLIVKDISGVEISKISGAEISKIEIVWSSVSMLSLEGEICSCIDFGMKHHHCSTY